MSGPAKIDYIAEMTIFPKFHIRENIFQRPYNRKKPKRPCNRNRVYNEVRKQTKVQGGWGGWPSGNRMKLSSSQAQLGQATSFPFPVRHPPHPPCKCQENCHAYLVLLELLPRRNRRAARVAVHAEPLREALPDEGGLRVLHLVGRPPRPTLPPPPAPGGQLGQLDGVAWGGV